LRSTRTKPKASTVSSMQKSHRSAGVLLIVALLSSVAAYVPPGKTDTAVRSDIPYIRSAYTKLPFPHLTIVRICLSTAEAWQGVWSIEYREILTVSLAQVWRVRNTR